MGKHYLSHPPSPWLQIDAHLNYDIFLQDTTTPSSRTEKKRLSEMPSSPELTDSSWSTFLLRRLSDSVESVPEKGEFDVVPGDVRGCIQADNMGVFCSESRMSPW